MDGWWDEVFWGEEVWVESWRMGIVRFVWGGGVGEGWEELLVGRDDMCRCLGDRVD